AVRSIFPLLHCLISFLHEAMDFFFSSRRRHTRSKRDWSSDVCSSDLLRLAAERPEAVRVQLRAEWFTCLVHNEVAAVDVGRACQIGRASCRERVERAVVGG